MSYYSAETRSSPPRSQHDDAGTMMVSSALHASLQQMQQQLALVEDLESRLEASEDQAAEAEQRAESDATTPALAMEICCCSMASRRQWLSHPILSNSSIQHTP